MDKINVMMINASGMTPPWETSSNVENKKLTISDA